MMLLKLCGNPVPFNTRYTTNVRRGTVTIICGCMFSGKTTELLRRLSRYAPQSVLTLKHEIDRRYRADAVVAHAGESRPAVVIGSAYQGLRHIAPDTKVVGLDEAHFFDMTLIEVAQSLAARGTDVILTSLDRDSWGRSFPVCEQLCRIADEYLPKYAVCATCGAVADRTQRLTPIVDGQMVGGPESYEARCAKCWRPPPEARPLAWP